jgi:hypothetical protein
LLQDHRSGLVEQTLPPVNGGDSTLGKLSCVDDDAQGQQLELLWERELDVEILSAEAWDQVVADRHDTVPQITEPAALALVGFFPVGLVMVRPIAKDAHAQPLALLPVVDFRSVTRN